MDKLKNHPTPTAPDYAGALKQWIDLIIRSPLTGDDKGNVDVMFTGTLPRHVCDTIRQALALAAELASGDSVVVPRAIIHVAMNSPELNPSNYDHDQVCELNRAMCEVCSLLCAAPAERG